MRLILLSLPVALCAVVFALFFRVEDVGHVTERFHRVEEALVDPATAAEHLARVLSFPTLASARTPDHVPVTAPFAALHEYLRTTYTAVFKHLKHETVNEWSLLLTWKGRDPGLKPLLLLSHCDVVPAAPGNWTHPPFGGVVADGYVWGRGAIDFKGGLVEILEAVTGLLAQGYSPERTVYLAFGHDEEVGGEKGAGAIAALLREAGVELELVVDEGGIVQTDGLRPLLAQPTALVGTSEKGFETWTVTVHGAGGHSSMPPIDGSSVASRVARFLSVLDSTPPPVWLVRPTTDFVRAVGQLVQPAPLRTLLQSTGYKVVQAILAQALSRAGGGHAALVRTTCVAVAVDLDAGAENILPQVGTVTVNCRLLPGHESGEYVREYLHRLVHSLGPDRRHITFAPAAGSHTSAPTPAAPSHGQHFSLVSRAIQESTSLEQVVVLPILLPAITDSRWYASLAGGRVYRFSPAYVNISAGELAMIHGSDERLSISHLMDGIRFYTRLLRLAT